METLIILIPALVSQGNHVEMLRVQSLLGGRLAHPGLRVRTCLVVDAVAPEFAAAVSAIAFDERVSMTGPPTGIRRATEAGIAYIRKTFGPNVFVLRVIQDTVVIDPAPLIAQMLQAMREAGDWLAGQILPFTRAPDNANFAALAALGIPEKTVYEHVNGCLALARLDVWERYYCGMPRCIVHYADDDVMSQSLLHSGGRLLALSPAWEHRHDASGVICRATFHEQRGERYRYAVLAPFDRIMPGVWDQWLELAMALAGVGIDAIAIASPEQRGLLERTFNKRCRTWTLDDPVENLGDLLLGAEAIIGANAGVVKLGALLGVPTLSIHDGILARRFPPEGTPAGEVLVLTAEAVMFEMGRILLDD